MWPADQKFEQTMHIYYLFHVKNINTQKFLQLSMFLLKKQNLHTCTNQISDLSGSISDKNIFFVLRYNLISLISDDKTLKWYSDWFLKQNKMIAKHLLLKVVNIFYFVYLISTVLATFLELFYKIIFKNSF